MIIEIEKMPDQPLILECRVPWQELEFAHQDAHLREDVEFNARIALVGDRALHIKGNCRTRIDFTCSRCLRVFKQPQSLRFDLNYLPHNAISGDVEEIELDEEDLDLGFYDGVRLDTNVVLAEQLVLAVPMKPLCSAECRGLCSQCGANLNTEQCDCQPQRVNPMEGALAEFKKYLESKKR